MMGERDMFGLLILVDDDLFFEYDKINEDIGNVLYNEVSPGDRKTILLSIGNNISSI